MKFFLKYHENIFSLVFYRQKKEKNEVKQNYFSNNKQHVMLGHRDYR